LVYLFIDIIILPGNNNLIILWLTYYHGIKGAGIMENRNKIHSMLEITLITLALIFVTSGCKKDLTKVPELNKETKSLHQAAADGDIEQIKLLIQKGADVNARDGERNTPLEYAIEEGNVEIIQLLIEAGADVNAGAPLQAATYANSIETVRLLIERGADLNAGPWTALHSAVWMGNSDIAELLIQKGADVDAKDERGMTPLHEAVRLGIENMIELLIDNKANVNAKDNDGRTPLRLAAELTRENKKDVLELLLAAGARIDEGDEDGRTALHYAARFGDKDLAEYLIDKGADVSSKDKYGRTTLHLAAESADGDIVEQLLARGAKVDEKDIEAGFTALHYAARFGNKNAADSLIRKGANVNAKDKEGHAPLYIAVQHDHKVAELLVRAGADGNIRTETGQTLFQLAQERKSIESTVPDMIFDGEPNSVFGGRIACGDVDGGGYDDIVIGAEKYNNNRGRAYLFYGEPDMNTTCDLIFEGESEGDFFGSTVSCGDIDNDGYDDILVGAFGYNNNQGRAYLYWGRKRNSMDANPDKIFDGQAEEGACFSLGCPGIVIYDIDNDGYRDIIFGASRALPYPCDGIGHAYLYYGNTKELMDAAYDLIFTSENSGDNFGFATGCGDVDNDGYGDIIIGARFYPGGGLQGDCIGRAYLYYGGSRLNIDAKADVIFDAESKDKRLFFGQGIICIDQNKDGFDDILIGAQGYKERQGRAYLFYGDTRANLDTVADKTFDGEVELSDYGFIIICGDIDGDDNNDIVIGADYIRQQVGRAYIYWGSELSGPSPKPGRIFTGENPGEWFSQGLACGDVNNDGYDDLVIGALGYKAGSEQGRAYLYYGGPR
jgi:ankyrin repeat protein